MHPPPPPPTTAAAARRRHVTIACAGPNLTFIPAAQSVRCITRYMPPVPAPHSLGERNSGAAASYYIDLPQRRGEGVPALAAAVQDARLPPFFRSPDHRPRKP